MNVKIEIAFEVETEEEEDGERLELTERIAMDAARQAAFDYLTFCTVSGVNTNTEEVETRVDGFGKCRVRLSDDPFEEG